MSSVEQSTSRTSGGSSGLTPVVSAAATADPQPSDTSSLASTEETNERHAGQEQALESHEVIELQTFSERKAWIEEKISFLEKMPPIEVFVGLDAIRASAEQVPGLPTRAELQQWIIEHDHIEKETEIFDSGELKKLKQFTKAATQRNLSPEDTDLIELTLTTIYELDKLLHLLRDRSENLELLGVRLTWEEYRTAAWIERRKILEDLKTFLDTRARWTPAVYDVANKPDEATSRRGSIASIASIASDTSISSSPAFSRSARFKLAELLSRDAAQFAGRITSLRHGKVIAAGKALDKLIDNSRKPVPEDLLDEQDRLEEKGIHELEHIGKFIMNVVMQWRKADEIYVETMKDQLAAQNLVEEVETARLHHPTSRQSAAFTLRADALMKRLSMRGDPASSTSTFPRPVHPMVPDQQSFNESLRESLSGDVISAMDLAKKADILAKDYRATYDAVKDAEILCSAAGDASTTLESIIHRFQQGVSVPSTDEDGTPPDLTSRACLEPNQHSIFLALLPSVLEEHDKLTLSTDALLNRSRPVILGLDRPGIDVAFKMKVASDVQALVVLRDRSMAIREDVVARVIRLREARKIWSIMGESLKELEDIRRQVGDAMEKQRWLPQTGQGTPLTPESPTTNSPALHLASATVFKQLDDITEKLSKDAETPLASLSRTLESPLNQWLTRGITGLNKVLENARKMSRLLESIQQQAEAMNSVRDEYHIFQLHIEDVKLRFDSSMQRVLSGELSGAEVLRVQAGLNSDAKYLKSQVETFINGLSQRVQFIAQQGRLSALRTGFVKRRFSSGDLKLGALTQDIPVELPFELHLLDDSVRADSNAFAMRLGGELQTLEQKSNHLRCAVMAKEIDFAIAFVIDDISRVSQELNKYRTSLQDGLSQENVIDILQSLSQDVESVSQMHRTRIGRSFSPVRELLRQMDSSPGPHDAEVHASMLLARSRAIDDAELKFDSWIQDVVTLKQQVSEVLNAQIQQLEQKRIAEELRLQAEKDHLEAEAAAALRAEQERLAAEEGERLKQEHLAEERRKQAAHERALAEEAELQEAARLKMAAEIERLAREAEEAKAEIERLRLEEEKMAEQRRIQAEIDRRAAEDAERLAEERRLEVERERRAKLETERVQAEERRLAEEKAEVERVREAAEEAERLRAEKERLLLFEKARVQEERERLAAEDAEELRLKELQMRLEEERFAEERRAVVEREYTSVTDAVKLVQQPEKVERRNQVDEDVFGLRVTLPGVSHHKTQELVHLQAQILSLRKRLRSIGINEACRPSNSSQSSRLPSQDQAKSMSAAFTVITVTVAQLPKQTEDPSVDIELRSLRAELVNSVDLLDRVHKLADLSRAIHLCDAALSDLLEHIDSFPATPLGELASVHVTPVDLPPEEQLSARLDFTRSALDDMNTRFKPVADDRRAASERSRILQTWSELEDMGNDRVGGKKSRPASVISARNSSGRESSASVHVPNASKQRKSNGYSSLSAGPSTRGRFLTPSHVNTRRAVSGSDDKHRRPPSQASAFSSNRSVSGPMNNSLYGSTFASRQRTTSLSTTTSTTSKQPSATPIRHRAQTGQTRRPGSPSFSDASHHSRSSVGPSRSSSSMSAWARAPRHSLSLLSKHSSPRKKVIPAPKKTYVANPKNKLDIAVGNVVNQLPVNINVEVVADTWKDQSGKYWIGDQDPKLCFCRILRSRTVMVRVGGGWSELSKFIKDHFADSFRLIPDSPSRSGKEEKWISSATLLEAPEIVETPPLSPRTPEPKGSYMPSFALSTPSGNSPHSLKSSPSAGGSPLTPLQFMRRADSPSLRPVTPTRAPIHRLRTTPSHTSARNSIWRP